MDTDVHEVVASDGIAIVGAVEVVAGSRPAAAGHSLTSRRSSTTGRYGIEAEGSKGSTND